MSQQQRKQVLPTLLDFEQMPGRYPLALREPRLLFDQVHTVLQLAAGRKVVSLPQLNTGEVLDADAQRAARFFVRTALLRTGTDPFTLLGLTPDYDQETLRDHYRMLIRMTHPDFAAAHRNEKTNKEASGWEGSWADSFTWPADAAQRINTANDTLLAALARPDERAALTEQFTAIYPTWKAASTDGGHAAAADAAPASFAAALTRMPAPAAAKAKGTAKGAGKTSAGKATATANKTLPLNDNRSLWQRLRDTFALPTGVKVALLSLGVVGVGTVFLVSNSGNEHSLTVRQTIDTGKPTLSSSTVLGSSTEPHTATATATDPQTDTTAQQTAMPAALPATPSAPPTLATAAPAAPSAPPALTSPVPTRPALTVASGEADATTPTAMAVTPPMPPTPAMPAKPATPAETAKAAQEAMTRHELRAERLARARAAAAQAVAPAPVFAQAPAPAPIPTPAPAPVLAAPAADTPEPAARLALDTRMLSTPNVKPRLEAPAPDVPTLAQAQPTLGNLLVSLQSGRSEEVLRWVDEDWRNSGANTAFMGHFNSMLDGRRVQQVEGVRFRSRQSGAALLVEGEMQLRLQDAGNRLELRPFRMRAQFQQRNGSVILTELNAI